MLVISSILQLRMKTGTANTLSLTRYKSIIRIISSRIVFNGSIVWWQVVYSHHAGFTVQCCGLERELCPLQVRTTTTFNGLHITHFRYNLEDFCPMNAVSFDHPVISSFYLIFLLKLKHK